MPHHPISQIAPNQPKYMVRNSHSTACLAEALATAEVRNIPRIG